MAAAVPPSITLDTASINVLLATMIRDLPELIFDASQYSHYSDADIQQKIMEKLLELAQTDDEKTLVTILGPIMISKFIHLLGQLHGAEAAMACCLPCLNPTKPALPPPKTATTRPTASS